MVEYATDVISVIKSKIDDCGYCYVDSKDICNRIENLSPKQASYVLRNLDDFADELTARKHSETKRVTWKVTLKEKTKIKM